MALAQIIDGKLFAGNLRARIGVHVDTLKAAHGLVPGLAVVLVGEDPASQIYVRNKGQQTVATGMRSFEHRLPASTTQAELLELVHQLNFDRAVHGILVQLPLPAQIDEATVFAALDPDKDVDGFHVINAGRLAVGLDGLVPCTPLGCLMLLQNHLGDLSGRKALVLGRSNIVGKPMTQLLLRENCTVTMAHSRTQDLAEECRRAEILIVAVGKPRFVKGDWIRPGATVVDVGINRVTLSNGRTNVVGDVDFDQVVKIAGAITPVPGGVGPMTIAMLLKNTLTAACRQAQLSLPFA